MTADKTISRSVIQNYYCLRKNNQEKIEKTVTVNASKFKLTLDVYIYTKQHLLITVQGCRHNAAR